jgi:hypothetical protein
VLPLLRGKAIDEFREPSASGRLILLRAGEPETIHVLAKVAEGITLVLSLARTATGP